MSLVFGWSRESSNSLPTFPSFLIATSFQHVISLWEIVSRSLGQTKRIPCLLTVVPSWSSMSCGIDLDLLWARKGINRLFAQLSLKLVFERNLDKEFIQMHLIVGLSGVWINISLEVRSMVSLSETQKKSMLETRSIRLAWQFTWANIRLVVCSSK